MNSPSVSRREFIQSTIAAAGAAAIARPSFGFLQPDTTLRVLSIGVIGTIGGADRQQVNAHPQAEIVGLCDVDASALAKAAEEHPGAFTCADYREAFDKYGDKFDAVIVA
ncbi:MAG: gfo/Idh/MocA family oxidoreductase, partial [Phycisphaerales bacterium JB039]